MRLFRRRKKLTSLDRRIASNAPELRHVDFSFEHIGDEGAKRLTEALRGNTVVTYLDLRTNSIGDAGARALAEMLKHNSTITTLHLWDNIISDEGVMALAEALEVNCSVRVIYLCDNRFGDVGATALAEALRHNSSVATLDLGDNSIDNAGVLELVEMLHVNSSIKRLFLYGNEVSDEHRQRVDELTKINIVASTPEDARRLKIVCKIGWLLESEVEGEKDEAVTLALDQLGSFHEADQLWGLFERLMGSPEVGAFVAASVDVATARTLYRYAADCGATPRVVMHLLRAHPSLCTCRDVRHGLFPFMLLATMPGCGAGDVLELLLLNPTLVESGIDGPVN